MQQHAVSPAGRILLDGEAIGRTLSRIAHEIIERNDDLDSVALVPTTGGVFRIEYDGDLIWERKRDGGFPDAATLKRLVRDRLDPARDIGHLDRH